MVKSKKSTKSLHPTIYHLGTCLYQTYTVQCTCRVNMLRQASLGLVLPIYYLGACFYQVYTVESKYVAVGLTGPSIICLAPGSFFCAKSGHCGQAQYIFKDRYVYSMYIVNNRASLYQPATPQTSQQLLMGISQLKIKNKRWFCMENC